MQRVKTFLQTSKQTMKYFYLPSRIEKYLNCLNLSNANIPLAGIRLDDYLCERFERTVNKDNTVKFEGLNLQIPQDKYRHHYVKPK